MLPEDVKRWGEGELNSCVFGVGRPGPEFLTLAEASQRLKVPKWTLFKAVHRGELPTQKTPHPTGHMHYVRLPDLELWHQRFVLPGP